MPLTMPRSFGTQPGLYEAAAGIEAEERSRYERGMGDLETQFGALQSTLSKGVDKSLLMGQGFDATGLRARTMMDRLRQNIGGRGIDPNSGAANGLLARLALQMDNANMGVMRDVEIEDARQRQVNAGQLFGAALNVFQARNQPVPTALADMGLNVAEMNLAERGLQRQERMTNKASKNNLLAGLLGGGLGILGRLAA